MYSWDWALKQSNAWLTYSSHSMTYQLASHCNAWASLAGLPLGAALLHPTGPVICGSQDNTVNMWRSRVILVTLAATILVTTDAGRRQVSAMSGLGELTWSARIAGNLQQMSRLVARRINKRQIALDAVQPNQPNQTCLLPSGSKGRCHHLQYCFLDDFRSNFTRVLDYLCIIDRSFVGVCCPETADSVGGVELLPPSSLAGLFPTLAQAGPAPPPAPPPTTFKPSPVVARPVIRPRPRGCGVSSHASTAPAEGGQSAPGAWPWVAAILDDEKLQFCGGVLITDRHVLSAAHCYVKRKPKDVLVRLGEYDLEVLNETRSRDFRVVEIRMHKDFRKATYENDIAVMKLHRPATFNSYIWPVCLSPPDDTFENVTTVVAGWGTLSFGGPPSDILMQVSVPVWPNDKCDREYAQPILDTMMCAGGYEGGKDACEGDSGGPLLYQMANKRWAVIGVVSWGIHCGEPNHPGVYTRLNRFLPWIFKNCNF